MDLEKMQILAESTDRGIQQATIYADEVTSKAKAAAVALAQLTGPLSGKLTYKELNALNKDAEVLLKCADQLERVMLHAQSALAAARRR